MIKSILIDYNYFENAFNIMNVLKIESNVNCDGREKPNYGR